MFKVNFKESSVARCCQGHFNRQDLGQGLIFGEELCVWVQLPVWAADLSPCTSRWEWFDLTPPGQQIWFGCCPGH